MKKNKYWKKGYKAAKKKLGKDTNPYRPVGDVLKQLQKNTLWIMGYEEITAVGYETERLKKELEERKKHKHKKHKHESKQEKNKKNRHERHEKRK